MSSQANLILLVAINPLDVLLWTIRRNESDVINLYDAMSPMMQAATGRDMLNFGYWDQDMIMYDAQKNLCKYFGRLAQLDSAANVIDVGSGLSAPAKYWMGQFGCPEPSCVNINYDQLCLGGLLSGAVNATSTSLPFSDGSADRILALESSQHFRPFSGFAAESRRVLSDSGLLVLAIPVTVGRPGISDLGILKFTWSSEHYSIGQIRCWLEDAGLAVTSQELIGSAVYEPLADYYVKNRERLGGLVKRHYSYVVEKILFKSLLKMRQASASKVIDYALIKCRPA